MEKKGFYSEEDYLKKAVKMVEEQTGIRFHKGSIYQIDDLESGTIVDGYVGKFDAGNSFYEAYMIEEWEMRKIGGGRIFKFFVYEYQKGKIVSEDVEYDIPHIVKVAVKKIKSAEKQLDFKIIQSNKPGFNWKNGNFRFRDFVKYVEKATGLKFRVEGYENGDEYDKDGFRENMIAIASLGDEMKVILGRSDTEKYQVLNAEIKQGSVSGKEIYFNDIDPTEDSDEGEQDRNDFLADLLRAIREAKPIKESRSPRGRMLKENDVQNAEELGDRFWEEVISNIEDNAVSVFNYGGISVEDAIESAILSWKDEIFNHIDEYIAIWNQGKPVSREDAVEEAMETIRNILWDERTMLFNVKESREYPRGRMVRESRISRQRKVLD